jgi:hypothetical protein
MPVISAGTPELLAENVLKRLGRAPARQTVL